MIDTTVRHSVRLDSRRRPLGRGGVPVRCETCLWGHDGVQLPGETVEDVVSRMSELHASYLPGGARFGGHRHGTAPEEVCTIDHNLPTARYWVVSETRGLLGTADTEEAAELLAVAGAVNTGRTTYVHDRLDELA